MFLPDVEKFTAQSLKEKDVMLIKLIGFIFCGLGVFFIILFLIAHFLYSMQL